MNGKILRILDMKGYGFIKGEDGEEYFFHRDDFIGNFDTLVGDFRVEPIKVTFDVAQSDKGPRACNVAREQ